MEQNLNFPLFVLRAIPEGIIFLNEKDEIVFFNEKAKEILNLDFSCLGKKLFQVKATKKFFETLQGSFSEMFERKLVLKENLILRVNFIPFKKEKKRIATLIFFIDITKEEKLEEMKTEVLTIVAHQLRGPISAMKWNLEMFLKEKIGPLNETQKNFVKEILKNQTYLLEILDDLLKLSKIEEGRILEKVQFLSLEPIVENVVSLFESELQKKQISLEVKKPPFSLPQLEIDGEKIKIAISNLVDNAIKYSKEKGKILISLYLLENQILFSIKDEGIGIGEKEKEKIFTKFFRGEKAKEIVPQGSGLGLYITKKIIEAHGGKIWVESEKDKGSTFYFTLPLPS